MRSLNKASFFIGDFMDINFTITKKQQEFIDSIADEVLFGGAAGGGKSYGQLIDAFLYAIKYTGSKQLILRRTFPELERSLIITALGLYPKDVWRYNSSNHRGTFKNGSMIEFGYCDNEKDVFKYQSAEYDVIRFDELTHFTEFQYTYLISRIRGVNNYPKQVKASTNPGGVGHTWVKARFIDNKVPQKVYKNELGRTTVFIPAKVQENKFLMESDPGYIENLKQLPDNQRKALLEGEWDLFEGQYFPEFNTNIHVIKPFPIPDYWNKYITLDYGLDMLACYWIALDTEYNAYVYKELYKSNLIISDAAKEIKRVNSKDNIKIRYAPPDLNNRRQETGKSVFEIFRENGIMLTASNNRRIDGWMAVKEWLKVSEVKDIQTGETKNTSRLKIFNNCVNLIRCLPMAQMDETDPNDVANEPHELTHSLDALRGFCIMRQLPSTEVKKAEKPLPFAFRENKRVESDYEW
jgi:phage terminase large subunit